MFAGGDCASGPSTLIHAMANGLKASRSIDDWIRLGKVQFQPRARMREILNKNKMLAADAVEVPVKPQYRVHHPELDPEVQQADVRGGGADDQRRAGLCRVETLHALLPHLFGDHRTADFERSVIMQVVDQVAADVAEFEAVINGKTVTALSGETILQCARRYGIYIPTLCELHDIDHTPGTCRVCLVDIHTKDGDKSHLATACTTPMQEGLEVKTRTPAVREMQRLQVELLHGRPRPGLRHLHPPRQVRPAGRRPVRRPAHQPLLQSRARRRPPDRRFLAGP